MRPVNREGLRRRVTIFALSALVAILAVVGSAEAKETLKLTILHMNDIHSHYRPHDGTESTGKVGGLMRAATAIKEELKQCRAEGRTPLLLMAGDLLTGTPYGKEYKGKLGVELMNKMGFRAMAVGNHEFDKGLGHLMKVLKPEMSFKLLSSNITHKSGAYPFDRSIEDRFPEAETRMVVFGLTLTNTPKRTGGNTNGLVFHDSIKTAKAFLKDYRHKDLVIALTHIGLDQDRKLARRCPKIDVIVGGHSHSVLEKPKRTVCGGPIIVQAGSYTRWLGRLDVDVRNGRVVKSKGRLIQLTSKYKDDPEIAAAIKKKELDAEFFEKIAETRVPLNGDRTRRGSKDLNCLGRLVAYLMAKAVGADLAFVNQGGIRASFNVGDITLYDAGIAFPFPGTVVKLTLSGKDLREVLAQSAAMAPFAPGILLTHGVEYRIACGNVKIKRVGKEPFDPNKKYIIATNTFLANGGDDHSKLKELAQDVEPTSADILKLLVGFLKEKQVITKEVLAETR